jgi:hypothetical protein
MAIGPPSHMSPPNLIASRRVSSLALLCSRAVSDRSCKLKDLYSGARKVRHVGC